MPGATVSRPLAGKIALVSGAGRGLGRLLALELARAGAAVAAHDLSPVHLDATVEAVAAAGGEIHAYTGESGKGLPAGVLVDEVLADFERIDLLFHCGWARPAAPLLQLDEWDWQRTFETNVTSPYLLLKLVGGLMRQQGGGAAGIFAVDARTPPVVAASQQARLALARAAAGEFLTYNISIFAICLGESLSNSGEAPLPAGGEPPELTRAVQLAVQLAARPAADMPDVVFTAAPNPSPLE